MKIAICKDEVELAGGRVESYSKRWAERAISLGHDVMLVSATQDNLIERVRGCDGFLWRFTHSPESRLLAKRILPSIEQGLGIPVFPNWRTAWHYNDKIAQSYLLTAAEIPIPRTRVFYNYNDAVEFCRKASFPQVMKLTGGASSENVLLLDSFEDAMIWMKRMFGSTVISLTMKSSISSAVLWNRLWYALRYLIKGWQPYFGDWHDPQSHYFLVQEFLPGNNFDTRVTVIGNRAFAYRRFNRENDFRSSGSGKFDINPKKIDLETVRLAFRVAKSLGTQSIAIDGLRRKDDRVVGEISYTYVSWVLHECPGYWELDGDMVDGPLRWVDGQVWPEDLIFDDFLLEITREGT